MSDDAGSAPGAPVQPPLKIDPLIREAWDYLIEVLGDYEVFVGNIGSLGYSAPQVLYYRDEVQETLDDLTGRTDINMAGAWKKVAELDEILRRKSQDLVDEIGHKNFIQYQIMNDPPRAHWWWWLNRVTAAPPPPPKFWEFWKYQSNAAQAENATPNSQPVEQVPARDPKIAKLFEKDTKPAE